LECVVSDETLAIKFIANGKKKIEEFAPNIIFEKWNNYLFKLQTHLAICNIKLSSM
jgi:hypothetical protein